MSETTSPCDDCKKDRVLDAWLRPNHPNPDAAPQADAHLCKNCHERRGPSAWGPWLPL